MRKPSLTPDQRDLFIRSKLTSFDLTLTVLSKRYHISLSTGSRIMSRYYRSLGLTSIQVSYRLPPATIASILADKQEYPDMLLKSLAIKYRTSISTVSRITSRKQYHYERINEVLNHDAE